MNLITELYWTIKWKIEDALYAIKDKFSKEETFEPFVGEEYITDIEEKPKKKKSKKKSAKKAKKSV